MPVGNITTTAVTTTTSESDNNNNNLKSIFKPPSAPPEGFDDAIHNYTLDTPLVLPTVRYQVLNGVWLLGDPQSSLRKNRNNQLVLYLRDLPTNTLIVIFNVALGHRCLRGGRHIAALMAQYRFSRLSFTPPGQASSDDHRASHAMPALAPILAYMPRKLCHTRGRSDRFGGLFRVYYLTQEAASEAKVGEPRPPLHPHLPEPREIVFPPKGFIPRKGRLPGDPVGKILRDDEKWRQYYIGGGNGGSSDHEGPTDDREEDEEEEEEEDENAMNETTGPELPPVPEPILPRLPELPRVKH